MNMERFYNNLVKVTVGVVIIGAITAFGYNQAKADDLDNFTKQAMTPVVQLERNCSGVVFNTSNLQATYLVTANHCVADEKSGHINLDTKDKAKLIETQTVVFDVIQRSIPTDLAVLKVRKEGLMLEGATIATEDPKEGEKVWTVGYPLGLTRTVTEGFFGGYMSLNPDMTFNADGNGRDTYRATPAIYGGNSGGGLFRKIGEGYQLVGITDAGFQSFFVAGFYNTQGEINEIVTNALRNETKEVTPVVQAKKND